MRVVVATRNAGKLVEFRRLFRCVRDLELLSLDDVSCIVDLVEDGKTYQENALKKASEVARAVALPALADDSGIEVDALGGAPCIHSARFAGERASDDANNKKLLALLAHAQERTARYRCVLVLVDAEGRELGTAEGTCEGRIAREPRGRGGFGYDPLFIPHGHTKHMAELSAEEKDQISHRGKAARKMSEYLQGKPKL